MSAGLMEFRDLDLMLAVDLNGGLTSAGLSEVLGLGGEGTQGAAVRAAWMRRFGMFDFDEKAKLWTLTPSGQRVVQAKRQAASLKAVERVPDESMVDVMSHVAARYRLGDPMMANLLRREFLFGTSPRSRAYR
jgi:hypothetical protein